VLDLAACTRDLVLIALVVAVRAYFGGIGENSPTDRGNTR
jgi:hypothetical protein